MKPVSEMQPPLATTKRVMQWLALCPPNESSSELQKRGYQAFALFVFTINLVSFTASMAYSIKHFYDDFDGAMYSVMSNMSFFGLIYSMIIVNSMQQQVAEIFDRLSTIYRKSKCEPIEKRKVEGD